MISGVSFLEDWSQTQNQNLHWWTEIELQNWSSCYISRELWHWNNLGSNSSRNKNGIFTFAYRKEIALVSKYTIFGVFLHILQERKKYSCYLSILLHGNQVNGYSSSAPYSVLHPEDSTVLKCFYNKVVQAHLSPSLCLQVPCQSAKNCLLLVFSDSQVYHILTESLRSQWS